MLPRPVELHNPRCVGACAPDDCIADLEALCRSVASAHSRGGVRIGGHLEPTRQVGDSDREDLVAFLIAAAWQASTRYSGKGRLAGFIVQRLHWGVTDWKRQTFGSNRWRPLPDLVAYDPTLHDQAHYDDESTNDSELDVDALSPAARFALENIIRPIVERDETQVSYARRMGVPASRVGKAFSVVRAELEALELEPTNRQ